MKLPDQIAGQDPRTMRDLLKAFINAPDRRKFKDLLSGKKRSLNAQFVARKLKLPRQRAQLIVDGLVNEGYLKSESLTPTPKGGALAQHIDRADIARVEADKIIQRVVAWAEAANSRSDARILIKRISVFGSYLGEATELGDIDLFVSTNYFDRAADGTLQPEDMAAEDDLISELKSISEYISPSSEFDELSLGVPTRQIFPH